MLRSVDVFSAWRLLPDLQTGIAHIPSDTEHAALLGLLKRVATTRVGVSPRFDNLADTAQALRFARVAVNARGGSGLVTVSNLMGFCPNCGGNLCPRPIRPAFRLDRDPPSPQRIHAAAPCPLQ